jgi:hypothetical protein
MNKSVLALFVLASLAAPAVAQQAEVPIDVFLEQRVAEELAVDGVILSRLGVALDVEAVGDKLIVSLVDPATRRAVASTKVDSLPSDREAAAAAITQVASNLAAQVSTRPAPADANGAAVEVLSNEITNMRRERDAEYKFRQEAISFGSELAVYSDGKHVSAVRELVAFQGDMRRRLAGRDFYLAVGREDLAEAYDRRRAYAWAGMLGGAAVMLGGGLIFVENTIGDDCDFLSNNYYQCVEDWEDAHRPYAVAGGVLMVAGGIGMIVGTYYMYKKHPISDEEIYNLGADFNANLRAKYGLPTSALRRPRKSERTFVVAPYALGDGGGLSVAGRF